MQVSCSVVFIRYQTVYEIQIFVTQASASLCAFLEAKEPWYKIIKIMALCLVVACGSVWV
jgi:hypothetical protein